MRQSLCLFYYNRNITSIIYYLLNLKNIHFQPQLPCPCNDIQTEEVFLEENLECGGKSLKTFKVHSTVSSRGYPLKSLQAVLCFNPLPSFLVWEQGRIVFLLWPNKKIMRTAIEISSMSVSVCQDAEWIEHPLLMLCVGSSNPAPSLNMALATFPCSLKAPQSQAHPRISELSKK